MMLQRIKRLFCKHEYHASGEAYHYVFREDGTWERVMNWIECPKCGKRKLFVYLQKADEELLEEYKKRFDRKVE